MRDRFHPVLDPVVYPCKPPTSFYKIIGKYSPGSEPNRTLHRVFSLMRKMKAQTLVVEDLFRRGELDDEARAVERRCGGDVTFAAWRFSFFAKPVTLEQIPYLNNEDYLGYAVFVAMTLPDGTARRYVYESVIREPALHSDDGTRLWHGLPGRYLHCLRKYSAWVAGQRFTLTGSFFCQQNGLTHVCAHAALRWLLNNLPERTSEAVSYEAINRDLGVDHVRRRVGHYGAERESLGLGIPDLYRVIEAHGYKYMPGGYRDPVGDAIPYWRFVYSIIESGYPVLVLFSASGTHHVICAIGHTLNSDIWDGEAKLAYSGAPGSEYISSDSWVDHFIIHDDNYGMYLCISKKALAPPGPASAPFQLCGVLGIVPAEVTLHPFAAELFSSVILGEILRKTLLGSCYWLDILKQEDASFGKWVVLRTLLVRKTDYEAHLRNMEDVDGNVLSHDDIRALLGAEGMCDHFWMTEVSLTDIYTANKRKLGEVLLKPVDPGTDRADDRETYTRALFSSCIAVRLPGNITIPSVEAAGISVGVRGAALVGHVPLFRASSAACPHEW